MREKDFQCPLPWCENCICLQYLIQIGDDNNNYKIPDFIIVGKYSNQQTRAIYKYKILQVFRIDFITDK